MQLRGFKTFLLSFLGLSSLVIGLNYAVDPGHRWHATQFQFSKNWNANEVMIAPKDYNDRAYANAHLKVTENPGLIFLGGSKATLIDQSFFKPTTHMHTLGVSGGSIEDCAAFWQELLDLKKPPTHIVMVIDPFAFNKNLEQFSWHTNLDLYNRFIARISKEGDRSLFKTRLRNEYWKAKHFFTEVYDLFSWTTTKESLRVIFSKPSTENQEYQIMSEQSMPKKNYGRRGDGSVRYPYKELFEVTPAELEERIKEFALAEKVFLLHTWQFNEGAKNILKALTEDIQAHNVKALFILPPAHPKAVELISKRDGYKYIFSEYQTAMEEVAKSTNTPLCNALDSRAFGCADTEFMDGQHWLPSCAKKVVQQCFKREKNFAELVL